MAAREPLPIRAGLEIPADEIEVDFARSGGPGGQNVNKVESKVLLRFGVDRSRALDDYQKARIHTRLASRLTTQGDLLIQADEYRDRARNLEAAYERLAELLRSALIEPKKRRPTRPTRSSDRKRLDGKKRRADVKRGRRGDDA